MSHKTSSQVFALDPSSYSARLHREHESMTSTEIAFAARRGGGGGGRQRSGGGMRRSGGGMRRSGGGGGNYSGRRGRWGHHGRRYGPRYYSNYYVYDSYPNYGYLYPNYGYSYPDYGYYYPSAYYYDGYYPGYYYTNNNQASSGIYGTCTCVNGSVPAGSNQCAWGYGAQCTGGNTGCTCVNMNDQSIRGCGNSPGAVCGM